MTNVLLPADRYETKQIENNDLLAAINVTNRDPDTYAAIQTYIRLLNLGEMDFLKEGKSCLYEGSIYNAAMPYFTRFARDYEFARARHGWIPVTVKEIDVDAEHDAAWMKKNKSVVDGNYTVKLKVPIVPPFGSYTTTLCVDKFTMEQHIVCQPTLKGASDAPPIYVIYSSVELPMFNTAKLQSPVAALINSWSTLANMELFAHAAHKELARPTLVVQPAKVADTDMNNYTNITMANADTNPAARPEVLVRESERFERILLEQKQFKHRADKANEQRRVYFSDPSNALAVPFEVEQSIESSIFTVPEGLEVAPQPTPAVPPTDMLARYDHHFHKVCNVFELPDSLFGAVKRTGAKELSTNDMQVINNTIAYQCEELRHALRCVLVIAEYHKDFDFSFAPRKFVNTDLFVQLFENGAITAEGLTKELFVPMGMDIKAHPLVVKETASSSSNDGKRRKTGDEVRKNV